MFETRSSFSALPIVPHRRRDRFLSSAHQVKDPGSGPARSPHDRSSSTAVAGWPCPDGCKKGGVCSKTWQATHGTTSSLFRLPTGTGAQDESCRTTQLHPCRTECCAWLMSHFSVPLPHDSGRRTRTELFMPSATALLGFEKPVRDFLGGWSAQASERYGRIAAQRIRNMQRTVVGELEKGLSDPLAEAETLAQLDEFFSERGVLEEERSRCSTLLERSVPGRRAGGFRSTETRRGLSTGVAGPQHKGRQGDAFLFTTSIVCLGKSPQEARTRSRAALEPGFYVCCSNKKKVRSLHQLGKCCLLPGVDLHGLHFRGQH